MSQETTTSSSSVINRVLYLIITIGTAMIGYHIHGSIFWSVMDWLFWPIAWFKWLVCHEVNMTVIRETFAFFAR